MNFNATINHNAYKYEGVTREECRKVLLKDLKEVTLDNLTEEDKWILTKYERVLNSTIKHMDKFEFNLVGNELYDFIWTDFCSNYIEFAKFNIESNTTKSVLYTVLSGILKMLHPFMPFVTEEIYSILPIKRTESIMISEYPKYDESLVFNDIEKVEAKVMRTKLLYAEEVELERGMKKGLEKGIEEGIRKEKLTSAKNMLKENIDIDTIIKVTGLEKEDIEKLK